MSCAHCSVASHPGISEEPTAETLRRAVMEMGEAGIVGLQYTGGEPLIRHKLLFELMELAHTRYGMGAAIVSNGFWGKKPERAREFFHKLVSLGLARLTISYDRFHAKFMGPEPVCNILEVARQCQWPVNINVTRTAQDAELAELLAPFAPYENVSFRFYDVQPVGEAEKLDEELRAQLEGFCSGCEQATVCDDGRVTACNGPAYFEPDSSALILGHIREESIGEMLHRHDQDPILQTIRLEGPMRLRETLESLPEFADFPFKEKYSGMCELCRQICKDPEAVAALHNELSRPEKVALRVAQFHVKKAARSDLWHRDAVNTTEARRALFLLLSSNPERFQREIDQVLSRADVDWYRLAQRVNRNGLADKLRKRRHFLERNAPNLFWDFLTEGQVDSTPSAELTGVLSSWQKSDFENLLSMAVCIEENPGLSEGLRRDRSKLGKLACRMLSLNGLILGSSSDGTLSNPRSISEQLGLATVSSLPYRHDNFFLKPVLHLFCCGGLVQSVNCVRLAARSLRRDFCDAVRLRGRNEAARLLAGDFVRGLGVLVQKLKQKK